MSIAKQNPRREKNGLRTERGCPTLKKAKMSEFKIIERVRDVAPVESFWPFGKNLKIKFQN
jgi:hypothetical protein